MAQLEDIIFLTNKVNKGNPRTLARVTLYCDYSGFISAIDSNSLERVMVYSWQSLKEFDRLVERLKVFGVV